jgi:ATP-binding cassette subfamily B protein
VQILRTYGRVLRKLGPEKGLAITLALSNVLLASVQFVEPLLFGRIVNALAGAHAVETRNLFSALLPLMLAWVAFGLFGIGAGILVALHADRLAHRRRLVVMSEYFEHVLSLPLAYHLSAHSGRVMKVMLGGADSMSWLWLGFFREHCAALVMLLVLLPLTLVLNPWLGGILVTLVLFFAVLTALVVNRTHRMQGEVTRHHTDLAAHAADALGNLPVVQSFTRIEGELMVQKEIARRYLEAQMPVLSWWAVATTATRAAATLTVMSILLVGTWLFSHGRATVGEIVAFLSLATMLVGRLEATVGFISALFLEAPKMAEFFGVLDTTPSVRDAPFARDAGVLSGSVAFEDVSFSYDGKRAAVSSLSFEVAPGETIALVGTTGSGKSTSLGLLHRAFDPDSGVITANGIDIREFTLTSLRRNIAVVFQEPMLFARSIRENLLVGRPDATDAELRDALERAQALEILERQPEGLDTVIGERGRTLSGGERQRLSIARALLKNPPILILDEATSALDATTEQKLKRALDEVMRGRTTFVIAHRLSTIRDADRVLVFEHGSVIEAGTFDGLVERGGRFAALSRAQLL